MAKMGTIQRSCSYFQKIDIRTFDTLNHGHYKSRLFRFPDPSCQVLGHPSSSPFSWYSHPGVDQDDFEGQVKAIDPATIMILQSRLRQDLSTYHLVFPFFIGPRKEALGFLRNLLDKKNELYQKYMTRFTLSEEKREAIFQAIDFEVLGRGYFRGYLQDKWDDVQRAPCGRPFEFMAMVSGGKLFRDWECLKDPRQLWNASCVAIVPHGVMSQPA